MLATKHIIYKYTRYDKDSKYKELIKWHIAKYENYEPKTILNTILKGPRMGRFCKSLDTDIEAGIGASRKDLHRNHLYPEERF